MRAEERIDKRFLAENSQGDEKIQVKNEEVETKAVLNSLGSLGRRLPSLPKSPQGGHWRGSENFTLVPARRDAGSG